MRNIVMERIVRREFFKVLNKTMDKHYGEDYIKDYIVNQNVFKCENKIHLAYKDIIALLDLSEVKHLTSVEVGNEEIKLMMKETCVYTMTIKAFRDYFHKRLMGYVGVKMNSRGDYIYNNIKICYVPFDEELRVFFRVDTRDMMKEANEVTIRSLFKREYTMSEELKSDILNYLTECFKKNARERIASIDSTQIYGRTEMCTAINWSSLMHGCEVPVGLSAMCIRNNYIFVQIQDRVEMYTLANIHKELHDMIWESGIMPRRWCYTLCGGQIGISFTV